MFSPITSYSKRLEEFTQKEAEEHPSPKNSIKMLTESENIFNDNSKTPSPLGNYFGEAVIKSSSKIIETNSPFTS
jgi:hypothetical protein